MTDEPVRWLDAESDASELERSLLGIGAQDATPPPQAQAKVWAALAAKLPPGGGDGGAGGAGTAGGGGVLGALKFGVGGAVAGGALALAAGLGSPTPSPAPLRTATASLASTLEATARMPDLPQTPATPAATLDAPRSHTTLMRATPAAPPVATAAPSADPTAASVLAADAERLRRARSALNSGDPAAAETALGEVSAGSPLGQEREALAIRTLWASGERDQARARARAFINRFPSSPHASTITEYAR